MKRATFLMIFLAGTLALSACAQPASPTLSTPTPTESPAVTSTEAAPGEQKVVTLDDQGKTVSLAVGESFLLKLGEDYTWDIQISDPNVISRVKNIMVIRGAQGVYTAIAAGATTLTAAGDPLCRQSNPPCAAPSILFSVSVVVK